MIFQKRPNFHASFISPLTAPFKFPKLSFILMFQTVCTRKLNTQGKTMLGTYLYIKSLNQQRFRARISTRSFFVFLIPVEIGIWKRWFLRRGKNRSTRRKTSQSHKKRTNNKVNPYMASTPALEPSPHWWQASALSPLRHPCSLLAPYVCENVPVIYQAKIPNLVLFFFEITLSSFIQHLQFWSRFHFPLAIITTLRCFSSIAS